jgi:hypothetical protein
LVYFSRPEDEVVLKGFDRRDVIPEAKVERAKTIRLAKIRSYARR